jgi:hypothetical protein
MHQRSSFQPWIRAVAISQCEPETAGTWWSGASADRVRPSMWGASPKRVSRYLSQLLKAATQRPVVP